MNSFVKNILIIFFFLQTLFFDNSLVALAKETSGITVHPAKENILVSPPNTVKKSLLIVNSSNVPLTLKVSVSDFKAVDEKGKIEFYEGQDEYSAEKWLVPQYEIITIPALDSKKMEYILSVSKDMPGKGYNGAIVFQIYNKENKENIGEPFGTLVNVNVVSKGITTGGTIDSFSMPFLQFKDPMKFGFILKNIGNSNLSVSGDIVFTNIFGKEINRFATGQLNVYPEATKTFEFQWSNSPVFGAYVATVHLINGVRNDNIISSWSLVLFFPWQKLAAGLLIIILAALLAVFLYRKYGKKLLSAQLFRKTLPKNIYVFSGKILSSANYSRKSVLSVIQKINNIKKYFKK